MNVNLRLVQDRMMKHTVEAPCKGLTAKALGKYRLEEETGLSVKFVSYQEAAGRPEVPLADEANVMRGSILNFSVNIDSLLQEHKQHSNLLRGLYESKLNSIIAKYSSRFFKPAVAPEDIPNKGGVASLFGNAKHRATAAEAALAAVGSDMTAEAFAAGLDAAYKARNDEQHVNTDEQLAEEFKSMRKAGVVKLMEDVMPLSCLIVQNFEVFMQLLPGHGH